MYPFVRTSRFNNHNRNAIIFHSVRENGAGGLIFKGRQNTLAHDTLPAPEFRGGGGGGNELVTRARQNDRK